MSHAVKHACYHFFKAAPVWITLRKTCVVVCKRENTTIRYITPRGRGISDKRESPVEEFIFCFFFAFYGLLMFLSFTCDYLGSVVSASISSMGVVLPPSEWGIRTQVSARRRRRLSVMFYYSVFHYYFIAESLFSWLRKYCFVNYSFVSY